MTDARRSPLDRVPDRKNVAITTIKVALVMSIQSECDGRCRVDRQTARGVAVKERVGYRVAHDGEAGSVTFTDAPGREEVTERAWSSNEAHARGPLQS